MVNVLGKKYFIKIIFQSFLQFSGQVQSLFLCVVPAWNLDFSDYSLNLKPRVILLYMQWTALWQAPIKSFSSTNAWRSDSVFLRQKLPLISLDNNVVNTKNKHFSIVDRLAQTSVKKVSK